MRLFERFDLGRDAAQVVHVVVAVQQAPLFVCVDLEALAAARGADRQRLVVQVYGELRRRVAVDRREDRREELPAYRDRQQPVVEGIVAEDVGEEARHHDAEPVVGDGPCGVKQLIPSEVLLEKELQNLIEDNMEKFFGVRFLKSEYVITNGRMDSIGIDENNCPVIVEYKRSSNENIINQGLFYLDWLLDHKDAFHMLVAEKYGYEYVKNIDWSAPCVICIASNFTRYDIHAINQMQKNIKLVKYKKYSNDLILFEHLNSPKVENIVHQKDLISRKNNNYKTHVEKLKTVSEKINILYDSICNYIESLGDDIESNQLKYYLAYKKVQNMACIEVYNKYVAIYLKLNPDKIKLEEGFTRDMRNIGHYGTGDLEIIIKDEQSFEKAKSLIEKAYNEM